MVIEDSVAGLPQVADNKWTYLKPQAIANKTTTFILFRDGQFVLYAKG